VHERGLQDSQEQQPRPLWNATGERYICAVMAVFL